MIRKLIVLAFFLSCATWLMAQTREGTFTGVVSDTMCGAKHTMGISPDSKCVRDCVKSNPTKYKYALATGDKLYVLSDQQTPGNFAAQRVKVTGTLYEKTGVIDVKKIEPVK